MKTPSNSHNQVAQVAQQNQDAAEKYSSRRRFLQTAAVATGGLALGLQLVSRADDDGDDDDHKAATAPQPVLATAADEVIVPLPAKVLAAVGGSDVVQTANDKVIVARTAEDTVVACSAVCTHRGCTVGYEHGSKEFVCPCHGARYALDGTVKQGPARRALKSYSARVALGLSTKPAV
jgi:cytochrome b6-f complex iron-sulfur subunit